ncbi:hypothetical protein CI109_106570 [Kwoniella shandongensis]|uniref:Uncharacterized protein n=1 Tax=Kwoniella shandongensis TaxID=1734106 RepID=A0A5M6C1Y3_9TREE|nr:uncharacterized protein CI109_002751 [Kwoniella shandongensis]KAA5528993.1 hypothetical protein CI109_002751 [Kwoniella shandongensis]
MTAIASTSRPPHSGPSTIIDDLDNLNFADSPSLRARMKAAESASAALQATGPDWEDQEKRSAPEEMKDPEGCLLKSIPTPDQFIEHLLSPEHSDTEPHLTLIGYELEALVSIYSPSAVRLSFASRPPSLIASSGGTSRDTSDQSESIPLSAALARREHDSQQWTDAVWDSSIGYTPGERIRYEVTLPVWEEGEELEGVDKEVVPDKPPMMRILVSLPPTYPNSSPPQLQLLGRYLGSFAIDSGLFGAITRTYISSNGVPFNEGDVCVFDGLTHVQGLAREWYISHLASGAEGEKAREAEKKERQTVGMEGPPHISRGMSTFDQTPYDSVTPSSSSMSKSPSMEDQEEVDYTSYIPKRPEIRSTFSYTGQPSSLPVYRVGSEQDKGQLGLKIYSSEAIVDRKSSFVGHAVRVTDEREVPLVVHELLSDRKIAKAHHPAIFAYRIAKDVGGAAGKIYNTDYDDDGETQAGARLKHLLEILELENVLVIVSRWYGGTLLGPDRFKHINQAARDALDLAGLLDEKKDGGDKGGKGRKGRK